MFGSLAAQRLSNRSTEARCCLRADQLQWPHPFRRHLHSGPAFVRLCSLVLHCYFVRHPGLVLGAEHVHIRRACGPHKAPTGDERGAQLWQLLEVPDAGLTMLFATFWITSLSPMLVTRRYGRVDKRHSMPRRSLNAAVRWEGFINTLRGPQLRLRVG
ncbi:hypothetical protein DENSPDRAFT_711918 [Dentipellis sp. KUC8613]|nr:hypothetical protein DENSPDRAFT_711918 [Dentipellis sp. KUC8613]